mgnify:CR=1 FL=1
MADLQAQIEQIISQATAQAAAQITALFRQSAADLLDAFGDGAAPAAKARGRKAVSARSMTSTTTPVAVAASPAGRGRARRSKGEKRPAGEIAALAKRVGDFIKKNPGRRVEQINSELGTTTGELALPLKKLIGEKAVRTKGAKRATTYWGRGK